MLKSPGWLAALHNEDGSTAGTVASKQPSIDLNARANSEPAAVHLAEPPAELVDSSDLTEALEQAPASVSAEVAEAAELAAPPTVSEQPHATCEDTLVLVDTLMPVDTPAPVDLLHEVPGPLTVTALYESPRERGAPDGAPDVGGAADSSRRIATAFDDSVELSARLDKMSANPTPAPPIFGWDEARGGDLGSELTPSSAPSIYGTPAAELAPSAAPTTPMVSLAAALTAKVRLNPICNPNPNPNPSPNDCRWGNDQPPSRLAFD